MSIIDRAIMQANAGPRLALIADSFRRLTGEPLVGDGQELWFARLSVVAHGTEDVPRFFYANRLALDCFRLSARTFIGMESRLSAAEDARDERAAMLARLEAADVVHGYAGVRVAGDGTRFRIEDAVIWNLIDEAGVRHGQAAAFSQWQTLH